MRSSGLLEDVLEVRYDLFVLKTLGLALIIAGRSVRDSSRETVQINRPENLFITDVDTAIQSCRLAFITR